MKGSPSSSGTVTLWVFMDNPLANFLPHSMLDNMTSVKEIIKEMEGATEQDMALVKAAYTFGQKSHDGHTRYSGEPYFMHPAAVAKKLAELGADASVIAAGLLHDTVEDADVSEEEIEELFGKDVQGLVRGVTKLGKHKYRGTKRHAESLRRLLVATSSDIRVLLIKLVDRYHNMTTIEHVPERKRRRIALETLEIYTPIADRLGMGLMKRDLEDLSFPHVDPDAYKHTLEVMKQKSKESEDGLKKIQRTLRKELAKGDITDFQTELRVKGLYSLYQKLERKEKDITKIFDIAAIRIIVKDLGDCYAALGIVHNLFKPIPGKIKDYIAFPKPNGYQSLHTTVMTGSAGIVEVQIRTEEMHRHAKYGIASHISYKELGSENRKTFEAFAKTWMRDFGSKVPEKEGKTKEGKTPQWVSALAEAQATLSESDEFMRGVKEDITSHRVFVFTPQGDVIDLPIDSSPIDFAYAIHSDIGDHLAGAKVNGKLVSLDTALKNGDRVEIMTRKNSTPTEKWLEMAKTSLARRHIKAQVQKKPTP